jgi:hypothetical protein
MLTTDCFARLRGMESGGQGCMPPFRKMDAALAACL